MVPFDRHLRNRCGLEDHPQDGPLAVDASIHGYRICQGTYETGRWKAFYGYFQGKKIERGGKEADPWSAARSKTDQDVTAPMTPVRGKASAVSVSPIT